MNGIDKIGKTGKSRQNRQCRQKRPKIRVSIGGIGNKRFWIQWKKGSCAHLLKREVNARWHAGIDEVQTVRDFVCLDQGRNFALERRGVPRKKSEDWELKVKGNRIGNRIGYRSGDRDHPGSLWWG